MVAISGPPGFGKTSVAIKVAHQLREMEIPTFFTSLRGMTSKDELVSKLLSIFADARQAVYVSPSHWLMQCLQQLRNPFVLVLDNADDLLESGDVKLKEDVLRFAEEILTQCSHIKLLFTTRESLDYLSHKIPIHNERVGVLDVASSLTLVRSLSPNFSDDNCSSIVRVCGQVPLAVRLMCSIMRQEHVSLNELLEELKISPIVEVLNIGSFPEDARLKSIISKSFERLSGHERDAFLSLAVFPGSFGVDEATAVLDLKTLRETKQVIRSLERKSLVTCSEDFSTCTIHSLLRSFIDERRKTEPETGAIFLEAQHRFYSHHISCFEMANEKFLTGQSNEALVAFLDQRESMILSLINGPSDKELYPKVVEVLSKAELFLFALLLDEESLFRTIYDTAVKEAQKMQDVHNEGKLLAAKSFAHWGWFSSDHQTWDDFFPVGPTDSADSYPVKRLCYFGIYQLLRGELDEGISSLQNAVNYLSSSGCDETILKQLVYDALAISCKKKQEHKMASYFFGLNRTMGKASLAYVGISPLESILDSVKDNGFCLIVTSRLIRLLRSERKALVPESLRAMSAVCTFLYDGKLESLSPEQFRSFWRLDINELKKQFSISTNMAMAFESISNVFASTLDMDPSRISLFALAQVIETALPSLESVREETKDIFDLLWPKLRNSLQPLKERLWAGAKSSEDDHDVDFEALARCYDTIGKLCYLINDYGGAIKFHQCAVKIREENIGDHVDTSTSLASIGSVHFEMGNGIEGIKSFQRALELREQLCIRDNVDTSNICHTLGDKHVAIGNYKEAIEAHLEALKLRKKYLGEDCLTGKSLQRIAEVYFRKGIQSATSYCNPLEKALPVESYKEALTFCQQALAMRLELLGEHMDTAESFHTLGCIHYKTGDMSSAVEAFHVASDMRSNLLGDDRDTVESYHFLGLAKCGMGDDKGALESLQKALQLDRKLAILYHPGIADIASSIGAVYLSMGDYHSAREQFQNAADLCEKLLDKHESTATSYHNLAVAHLAVESYPEALECLRQASTMRLEVLGQHVHTADSFHMLGVVHYKTNEFTSAVVAFQKASDIRLEVLGQHVHTANSFHMLGVVHHKINEFTSAVGAFQKALDMRSPLLGDHQDTAESYYWLGLAKCAMGDHQGALESLQKALQLVRKLSKGDQPAIADITSKIGEMYYRMGDYHSAREQFQNAVDLCEKLLDKRESTATIYHSLAEAHLALESYPEALECFRQASTMKLAVLGQHVHTANSFHMLGVVHHKTNEFTSAVVAFQRALDMRTTLLGDHQDTAESYYWLGLAKCAMGDPKGALEFLQKASQLERKLSKGDQHGIADITSKMGGVYYNMGDYHIAREQFQNAEDLCEKLLDKHESTTNSYTI